MSELRFADPETLSLVSRMELVARQSVEGFLSGLHPSPYHGSSVEYADHRPYSDGDEIRVIDWKLLAKTDKYYVKLFEEQTNVRCTIVTDVSNSMSFGVKRDAGIRTVANKLEYAFFLSATLAYLMLRQNDAVGLVLFDNVLHCDCGYSSLGLVKSEKKKPEMKKATVFPDSRNKTIKIDRV